MNIWQFIEQLKDFAQAYTPLAVLTTTLIGFVFGLKTNLWSHLRGKLKDFWNTDIQTLKNKNRELTAKLDRVRDAFIDDNNLWRRTPVDKPPRYDADLQASIPIILLANLKGGVGKTTIAANLAAYFERCKDERVLAIDLDHQGSLSSMLLPESTQRNPAPADTVKRLIGGDATAVSGPFAPCEYIRHTQRHSRLVNATTPSPISRRGCCWNG